MSAGLFGAYTGNPRIQRAYASPTCTRTLSATDDTSLRTALDDSTVTCIEIQGHISLQGNLPVIDEAKWNGSARESDGLTVFGTGDDTIDGDGQWRGLRILLTAGASSPVSDEVKLTLSDVTMTEFDHSGGCGGAAYVYLFDQSEDARVTLDGVGFSNNSAVWGAGVYVGSKSSNDSFNTNVYVDIVDSTFSDNSAGSNGGAVYAYSLDDTAITTVTSSAFNRNEATQNGGNPGDGRGGAIMNNAPQGDLGKVIINGGVSFTDNEALNTNPSNEGRGGAIYTSHSVAVQGSANHPTVFSGNASQYGGAIFVEHNGGTIDKAVFQGNSATGEGGAFFAKSSTNDIYLTMTDSEFDGNQSAKNGGAVYVSADDTALVDMGSSTFTDNSATGSGARGGGAFVQITGQGGRAEVLVDQDAYFGHNDAAGYGGAIFATGPVTVTGDQEAPAIFAYNSGDWGGAIYTDRGGADIQGAVFHHNSAVGGGGAIYASRPGDLTVSDSTFSDNQADSGAGAWSNGYAYIVRSAFVDNVAQYGGGGLFITSNHSVNIVNSFLGGNTAQLGAGGGIAADHQQGDVSLMFTTMYDDSAATGATEIWARDINSTMSAVGSSTSGDIWELVGTIDDTNSVSTSDDTQFDGNVAPGSFDLGARTGTLPGTVGRTPNPTSPLAVNGNGGFATASNPLSSITLDQLGVTRVFPFTVGARQAVVAPYVTSISPSSGTSAGGTPVAIHGTGFTGATTASIGGTAVTSFVVVDDTTITGVTPSGSAGPAAVTVTNPAGINTLPGGFTFVSPNPPIPPAPEPASAPRDVSAVPGVESAEVSWRTPASTGSFPITSYEAVTTPGSRSCVVQAPALSCTIAGLTPGTTYTVKVRALNGAGWGEMSAPSAPFTPAAPLVPSILIAGARSLDEPSVVRVDGTSVGLAGQQATPYVKLAGQTTYTAGTGVRTIDSQGRFQWQRKTGKKVYVFFLSGDTRSNRVTIPAK